jgi:glutamate synthase (NADPH) large chain
MDEPRSIRTDVDGPYGVERDACALILSIRKRGESTYGTLKRALQALARMGHRTGFVDGEGDGAGVQTDIPRQVWAQKLSYAGLRSSIATDPRFWVGHCFVPRETSYDDIASYLSTEFNNAELNLLLDNPGRVRLEALGKQARATAPQFVQLAGFADDADGLERRLFRIQQKLEQALPIHFASLSNATVVYKVRGSVEVLPRFYPDLQDRNYSTAMALCHARYSTNTASSFERVQPFALLGHNGEINTINRFRREATQIGVELDPGNSDSQDIDRVLHTLIVEHGLSIVEAMELVFPPVPHEVEHMPEALRNLYTRIRRSFGPFAQGPAAVVSRYDDLAVMSVDALGLRPLWFIDTEKEYIFSSERGVIPLETMVSDARPLAPGEKMAVRVTRGHDVKVFDHNDIREHVMKQAFQREVPQFAERYWRGWGPSVVMQSSTPPPVLPTPPPAPTPQAGPVATTQAVHAIPMPATVPYHVATKKIASTVLAANGWNREHIQEIRAMVNTGKDVVGSLGHDGPLAVLSQQRVNLGDFFKETVAVVTNPSIDRERESEAFSTHAIVGVRPSIGLAPGHDATLLELDTPLLAGGHAELGDAALAATVAELVGTLSFEQVIEGFEDRYTTLTLGVYADEDVSAALDRLTGDAIQAVSDGVQCVILDDVETVEVGLNWLDPHLATAAVDRALREAYALPNLRRQTALVVRSGGVRTLHDIALLLGIGADAICPYAMLLVALGADRQTPDVTDPDEMVDTLKRVLRTLTVGLEKVISTIGCHELRGYGRMFSSIGLAPSLAAFMDVPNYFGNEDVGMTWLRLERESQERGDEFRGDVVGKTEKVDRFYPKFWKKAESVAKGELSADEFIDIFHELTEKLPVSLRHVLGVKTQEADIDPDDVDLSVDIHDMPVLISAMSFGSQGELAYRAYAEAATNLNIICVNGEGGELPDLLGKDIQNRGQQVASGRFGVNAEFLNSAYVLEIKVGQGAKPGEGGMLPSYKVTPQVAEARRTNPFIPLISPSNNHDIYSIEDLAQLIEELKTVNPDAKVSVKVPVVPGIGLIACGVAKAGADIINLTGYDGATGAARRHALQYVGLPTEIGVVQAHRALIETGLRHRVEIWCDGGMKSGADAVKMMLLGANRVGFATMAMVAIGCTICRKCHEGTCHVGITTHIKTVEEAKEKGLKSFRPRDYEASVVGIERVFAAIALEMRRLAAQLGFTRLQDLVGRADLLEQIAAHDCIDLSPMLEPVPNSGPSYALVDGGRRLTRPRNILTKMITDVMLDAIADNEREATYQDEVMAHDRALGSHLAGELVRSGDRFQHLDRLNLRFGPSAVAGNGYAAWAMDKLNMLIEGGAQDGAAKSASGGRIAIMKGLNHNGKRVDGSVGKSFAYGAQRGILIVQGDADSRACIRLSGADVIFGGEIKAPINTTSIGTTANIKGFACEYMTSGRVLIMGDPGPYAFAGMTGGVVYQRLSPEYGFTLTALQSRLANGATVTIEPIEEDDVISIQELLGYYIDALEETDQPDTANDIRQLARPRTLHDRFVKVVPIRH